MKQAQAAAISESVHFVRGVFIDRPVNRNMTAYRLQSGTSCIGYQSDNGSSSIRVFSCTTACTIYHPALCPACVGRSLLTIVADIYDQLHAVTSSSQPQKKTVCYGPRSFAIAGPAMWNSLPASLHDDQLSVAAFRRLLKTELFTRAYDSSLARSWLLLTVRVGEHNFNYYYTTTTTTNVCHLWALSSLES